MFVSFGCCFCICGILKMVASSEIVLEDRKSLQNPSLNLTSREVRSWAVVGNKRLNGQVLSLRLNNTEKLISVASSRDSGFWSVFVL